MIHKQHRLRVGGRAYSQFVLSLSPALYWPMQSAAGDAAAWAGGQAGVINGGCAAGAAGPIAREDSRSYSFNGAGGYLEAANPGSVLNGKFITVSAWIRHVAAGTSYPRIIDRVYNGQFCVYVYESGMQIGAALKNAAGSSVDRSQLGAVNGVVTGAWQHVAVTWDGSAMRSYIGGAADGVGYAFAGTGLANSTSIVRIGQRADGSNRDWEGNLCHVAVFDRVLTTTEIAALYAVGKVGN